MKFSLSLCTDFYTKKILIILCWCVLPPQSIILTMGLVKGLEGGVYLIPFQQSFARQKQQEKDIYIPKKFQKCTFVLENCSERTGLYIRNRAMRAQSTNMSVLPYQNHPSAPTPTPSIRTKLWGGNWKMWKLKKIILMKEIKVKNVALANEFRDHYSQIWLRPERCP